ncbi:MAG: hypothetical protein IKD06_07015 [Clostridia bacterium]|nr:hypothetical protein [Clostridia bacterium]
MPIISNASPFFVDGVVSGLAGALQEDPNKSSKAAAPVSKRFQTGKCLILSEKEFLTFLEFVLQFYIKQGESQG